MKMDNSLESTMGSNQLKVWTTWKPGEIKEQLQKKKKKVVWDVCTNMWYKGTWTLWHALGPQICRFSVNGFTGHNLKMSF